MPKCAHTHRKSIFTCTEIKNRPESKRSIVRDIFALIRIFMVTYGILLVQINSANDVSVYCIATVQMRERNALRGCRYKTSGDRFRIIRLCIQRRDQGIRILTRYTVSCETSRPYILFLNRNLSQSLSVR